MIDPRVRCSAVGTLTLSCTFAWQDDEDPHVVTFYVEDWKVTGSSIDG